MTNITIIGNLILLLFFSGITSSVSAQNEVIKKYILVPHPRSDDKTNQSSLTAIEKIDFTKFSMVLLGGDLTYYTTTDRTAMDHTNSIFNLGSDSTLWTVGNHDLNNPSLITEYTGRPRYYAYNKDNITFIVLDTEEGSSGFVSSHITPSQVELVQNVVDTITDSKYLILLHHRLLWMIGDTNFASKIDSVGESTRQLDTSNFNQVVFPLLQKAKQKGKLVICLGGDKSKINFQYSPEDSITYIASTMGPEFSDTVNHVVVLSHELIKDTLYWNYVPLYKTDKKVSLSNIPDITEPQAFVVQPDYQRQEIIIKPNIELSTPVVITVFEITGRIIKTINAEKYTDKIIVSLPCKGITMVTIAVNNTVYTYKMIF